MALNKSRIKLFPDPPLLTELRGRQKAGKAQGYILPDTFEEFCKTIRIKSLDGQVPFELLEWQRRFSKLFLEDLDGEKASFNIIKSRQIGNTILLLVIELWLSLSIPEHKSLVLHLTYSDSWNLSRRIRRVVETLRIPLRVDSLRLLGFENGSEIHFRSADPHSCGAGLEAVDLIHIEESGYQQDLTETLRIVDPMRKWSPRGKLVMVGTPNGKQLAYYQLLKEVVEEEEIEETVKLIRAEEVDPYQVFKKDRKYAFLINWRSIGRFREQSNPGFLEEIRQESNSTETAILQEFELEFTESESAVFPVVLVHSCKADIEPIRSSYDVAERWYEEPISGGVYFAGGDPNGGSNKSTSAAALTMVRKLSDKRLKVVYTYRKKSGTTSNHVSRWAEVLKDFDPIESRIETNNTGNTWIEQLGSLAPGQKIEGSKTTEATRPGLITVLTICMEQGDLCIPEDSQIVKELLSFIRDENGRPQAAKGCNDDLVFALMHTLKAARYRAIKVEKRHESGISKLH